MNIKELNQEEICIIGGGHSPEEALLYGCGVIFVIGVAIGWFSAAFYYTVSRVDKKIDIWEPADDKRIPEERLTCLHGCMTGCFGESEQSTCPADKK